MLEFGEELMRRPVIPPSRHPADPGSWVIVDGL